jgi:hypothetical protein
MCHCLLHGSVVRTNNPSCVIQAVAMLVGSKCHCNRVARVGKHSEGVRVGRVQGPIFRGSRTRLDATKGNQYTMVAPCAINASSYNMFIICVENPLILALVNALTETLRVLGVG